MNKASQPRRRAVRLTEEARAALANALVQRWRQDEHAGKLTRQARADLMGVSPATAERILNGEGVDRASLSLVHKRLGLNWSRSLYEYVSDTGTRPIEAGEPVSIDETQPPLPGKRRKIAALGGLILTTLALACLGWFSLRSRDSVAARAAEQGAIHWQWATQFDGLFQKATEEYGSGEYGVAEADLDAAIRIARKYDSVGMLASAVRLHGDLSKERGVLPQARRDYEEALTLRGLLRQDETRPPLLEALGDVETDLGDYNAALVSLNESLLGFKRGADSAGVAMAARDLGTLAFRTHDAAGADRWFRTSLDAISGESKPELEADIRARQALLRTQSGQFDEARSILRECLRFWVRQDHPRWIARTEFQLASVEAAAGRKTAAIQLCSQCEAGFDKVGDTLGKTQAHEMLRCLSGS